VQAEPARHDAALVPSSSDLPLELLCVIFSRLCAADLTHAAATCRAFRIAADDEALWRRLYCARWGQFEGCESKLIHRHFWKVCVWGL